MESHRQVIDTLLGEVGYPRTDFWPMVALLPNERHRVFYALWSQDCEDEHVRIVLRYELFEKFGAAMREAFNDFDEIDWNVDTIA